MQRKKKEKLEFLFWVGENEEWWSTPLVSDFHVDDTGCISWVMSGQILHHRCWPLTDKLFFYCLQWIFHPLTYYYAILRVNHIIIMPRILRWNTRHGTDNTAGVVNHFINTPNTLSNTSTSIYYLLYLY